MKYIWRYNKLNKSPYLFLIANMLFYNCTEIKYNALNCTLLHHVIVCLLLVNNWAPLYYIDNWDEMILSFLYTGFQPMYDCGLPGAGDYCLEAPGLETIKRLCFHQLRFQQRYFNKILVNFLTMRS